MMKLRTFAEKDFETQELLFIGRSFRASYLDVISRASSRPFVKFYRSSGSWVERTFGEFDLDVRRVAAELERSHPPGSLLATLSENSYELMVYIAATLLSGFSFCPLNPNDAPAKTQEKLAQLGERARLIKDLSLPPPHHAPPTLPNKPPPDVFIHVFTSGSTGESKVVEQLESGLLANAEALARHHGLSFQKQTVIATPLPLFHVNALEFSFLTSLLTGQRLICYQSFDLLQALRSLEEDHVQIFSAVPHVYHLFARTMKKLESLTLPHFRYFLSAASPLPLVTLERFCASGFRLLQGYGLSEAINFSLTTPTDLPCADLLALAQRGGRPSAGVSLWGNDVFVLQDGEELPEGREGDIAIRGLTVMRGYKDHPPSKAFENDFLMTGDRGFFLFDADRKRRFFFISGRTKDIVKKYGATVSLVKMDELLLTELPEGSDGISVGFESLACGEDVAFILKNCSRKDAETLAEKIAKTWPKDQRVSLLLLTDRELRTSSGKPLRWPYKDISSRIANGPKLGPSEIPVIMESEVL